MSKVTVEFEPQGSKLLLVYRPRDDDSWVADKFAKDDQLVIKGTFHLSKEHLVSGGASPDDHNNDFFLDAEPLKFLVASKREEYYQFNSDILPVGCPILIHCDSPITWKWFTAEKNISIFRIIADLSPSRIVIGGKESDAIPIVEFEKLIDQFPSAHELKRYVLARVSAVVREYSDSTVDADRLYRNYVGKRLQKMQKTSSVSFALPRFRSINTWLTA